MKTLLKLLVLAMLVIPAFAADQFKMTTAEKVKPLLVRGIELYIDNKYTLAIRYFEEVQKIDPKNELAKQYIESSRQRLSEIELAPELAIPNKVLDK